MGGSRVVFPCDLPNWKDVSQELQQLRYYCQRPGSSPQGMTLLHQPNGAREENKQNIELQNCIFHGLMVFLEQVAYPEESEKFLRSTLPAIIDMALLIEQLVPDDGLYFSEKQCSQCFTLSRQLVASIIACAFLCLFPERKKDKSACFNVINFTKFFQFLPLPSQCAKLRCVLHYFERIFQLDDHLAGFITFERQVMDNKNTPLLDTWFKCPKKLCPVFIDKEGRAEEARSTALKIVFSHRFIGGNVLGKGRHQEEILFSTCPELIASMLFMEAIDENEAITIKGYEKFSSCKGWADTLSYAGDFQDVAKKGENGNLKTIETTVNATPYRFASRHKPYTDRFLLRDLNKILAAFQTALVNTADDCYSKIDAADDFDFVTTTTDGGDEGEKKEVKFVEDVEGFAKRLSKDILATATWESCGCGECGDPCVRPDREYRMTGRQAIVENSPLHSNFSVVYGHTGMDYLDVDYHEWISNFRRRSSNLSDLTSRRSSCSTRYSSDVSSDFEEYYELFLRRDQVGRPGTIHEENGYSNLHDFAASFIKNLLQESAEIAYQTPPGLLNFQNGELPMYVQKPLPIKLAAETKIDQNANVTFMSEDAVQSCIDEIFEEILPSVVTCKSELCKCSGKSECHFLDHLEVVRVISPDPCRPVYINEAPVPKLLPEYADRLSTEIINLSLDEYYRYSCYLLNKTLLLGRGEEHDTSMNQEDINLQAVADKLVQQIFQEALLVVEKSEPSSPYLSRHSSFKSDSSLYVSELIYSSIFTKWLDNIIESIIIKGTSEACKITQLLKTIENHGLSATYSTKTSGVVLTGIDQFSVDLGKEIFTIAFLEIYKHYLINPYFKQVLHYTGSQNFSRTVSWDCCSVMSKQNSLPDEDLASFARELERQNSLGVQNQSMHRSSSGFRDVTLSQFAEQLMRSNPTTPALQMFRTGGRKGSGSGQTGCLSGFKDDVLASFEDELLRSQVSSFTTSCCSSSHENIQSLLKLRTNVSHGPEVSQTLHLLEAGDDLVSFAEHFAEWVIQESFLEIFGQVSIDVTAEYHYCLEKFAEQISENILHIALLALKYPSSNIALPPLPNITDYKVRYHFLHKNNANQNAQPTYFNIPYSHFADEVTSNILHSALTTFTPEHQNKCLPIATSCGIQGANPQLEALLQWMAASYMEVPILIFYTSRNEKISRFADVVNCMKRKNWSVGQLMEAVHGYCEQALEQLEQDGTIMTDLFEEIIIAAYK